MQPNRTVVAMLLPLALLACNAMPSRLAGTSADLSADPAAAVAKMMQGHYDSRDQAAADKTYFPIALAMVPIWPERSDGYWLYVEQAMADSPDKPYRQRVYRVYNGERGEVISEVFTFAGPLLDEIEGAHIPTYVRTMKRLRDLSVKVVHAGHDPSFGRARLIELVDAYLAKRD